MREELVSTIDIFPTLMEVATGNERHPYQGRSLLPLTHEAAAQRWRRYLFTEYITHAPGQFYPRYGVRDERYKLILNTAAGKRANPLDPRSYCNAWWEAQKDKYKDTPIRRAYYRVEHPPRIELYDLQNDPFEWNNLAADPKLASVKKRLFSTLRNWREITNDPLSDPVEYAKQAAKTASHD